MKKYFFLKHITLLDDFFDLFWSNQCSKDFFSHSVFGLFCLIYNEISPGAPREGGGGEQGGVERGWVGRGARDEGKTFDG